MVSVLPFSPCLPTHIIRGPLWIQSITPVQSKPSQNTHSLIPHAHKHNTLLFPAPHPIDILPRASNLSLLSYTAIGTDKKLFIFPRWNELHATPSKSHFCVYPLRLPHLTVDFHTATCCHYTLFALSVPFKLSITTDLLPYPCGYIY